MLNVENAKKIRRFSVRWSVFEAAEMLHLRRAFVSYDPHSVTLKSIIRCCCRRIGMPDTASLVYLLCSSFPCFFFICLIFIQTIKINFRLFLRRIPQKSRVLYNWEYWEYSTVLYNYELLPSDCSAKRALLVSTVVHEVIRVLTPTNGFKFWGSLNSSRRIDFQIAD